MPILFSLGLLVLADLCEISAGHLVWLRLRELRTKLPLC